MRKLIAIGGWGCSRESIEAFRLQFGMEGYSLSPTDFEPNPEALGRVLEAEEAPVHVLGWSLGGMLALATAAQRPQRFLSLSLCASGPRFTRRAGDRVGMRAMILQSMRQRLEVDCEAVLQSFAGFMKAQEPGLLLAEPQEHLARLAAGLEFLERFSFEADAARVPMPVRIVHGAQDPVVPASYAEELKSHLPQAALLLLPDAGHIPWKEAPQACLEFLRAGIQHLQPSSQSIARQFSLSAPRYGAEAKVQARLERRLEVMASRQARPRRVLDIGCGTGSLSRRLAQRWPSAQIEAVDFAPDMIAYARSEDIEDSVLWHCTDFMKFLPDAEYDLIVSNATMQWLEPLDEACRRIASMLHEGGRFIASVFLAGSLPELARARLQVAPDKPALLRLPCPEILLSSLREAGFEVECAELSRQQLCFPSAVKAVAHLKHTGTTGAHQPNQPGAAGRLTRRELRALYEAFERSPDGGVRLSFQTLLLDARRCR